MVPISPPNQLDYTLPLDSRQGQEMLIPLQVLPAALFPRYFSRPHGLCRKQVTM
jgi:hypothetical protein